MNIEIEKKYQVEGHVDIRPRIIALGVIEKGSKTDIDTYFRVPEEKPSTRYLRTRVREGSKEGIVAYHEVLDNDQTLEWETTVNDSRTIQEIFEKLGFPIDVVVEKRREKYELEGTEILLDTIKGLGNFVEIESKSLGEIERLAKLLSLSNEISGKGYPDLVKEHETLTK